MWAAAPGIAHMWHMPGHVYSDLQRYEDAAWQQEASARVDHAYMMRDRVMPYQIHNYAHNNESCIRDLTYVGRVHDAIALAKNMIELPRNPK
ncbi:MAG: bcp 5 [Phycisphaerales bacterium]|nr:bcp 5 [Phycisphaerales bacterium]MDB5358211.1 bcp 5 [Phycisphaerales bacterium]